MTNYKKITFTIFLAMFVSMGVVTPKPADAFFADVIGGPTTIAKYIWERVEKVYDTVQSIVGSELSNRTVGMFLDSLAYDVATELAEGGAGGKPQFRTVSIEKALQNSKDKALGEFLGELTEKGFDELGINLCDPSLELKLTLTLGLIDEEKPPKPSCDWQRLSRNWKQFEDNVQSDIIRFQLDPKRNGVTSTSEFFKGLVSRDQTDLGIAFKLYEELNKRKVEAEKVLDLDAEECNGFRSKTTTVSDEVITHCRVILSLAESQWPTAAETEAARQLARKQAADNKKLSDILKDAGNKFINTFTSKLMNNWIKRGMWSLFGSTDNDIYQDYRNTLIDRLRGGSDVRQPRGSDIFKDIVSVNVESIDDFDYLNIFTICPSDFRNPDNCVMSPAFLQAVNNKLTIQQAVERGIIDSNMPFVHPDDHQKHTVNNCYRDALCYSNLVKLRKANMVPVGWELAALRAPVTLQQAMNCFEEGDKCEFDVSSDYEVGGNNHNPFYHLVDPDWVLKAPQVRCEAYAYSSILESPESANRQQYCADTKVCLREDSEGNCVDDQYEYCTRSENVWDFQGQECQGGDTYAGCLTFVNEDFGSNSYIQDTLEYCNSNQAGCRRYSQEKDANGDWVLEDIAADINDLFLNKQSLECNSEDAGCSEYIVMNSNDWEGYNLVPNGDFDDWNNDGFPDTWYNDEGNLTAGINDPDGIENTLGIEVDYDGDVIPVGYHYGSPNYGAATTPDAVKTGVILEPNTSYRLAFDSAQYNNGDRFRSRARLILCNDETGCGSGTTADNDDTVGNCVYTNGANIVELWSVNYTDQMSRRTCSFTTNDYVDYGMLEIIGMPPSPATNPATAFRAAVLFDNLKLEKVESVASPATAYSDSDYSLGTRVYMDSSTVMCSEDEVGCQGYIPKNGDPMIPAVITQGDLCPLECVGYDTFTEQPNTFDVIEGDNAVEYYNFIADTAESCPAQAVGCEEFTNLDVVAQGGEGREYFTYLRQCVTPNLGETYYTWEGSEVAGYQIKTWNALPSNLDAAPCTNMAPEGTTCLDVAFDENNDFPYEVAACGPETNNPNDNIDNDPNCRQFFDINGDVYYRLQDRVIFATDDCHDYRRARTDQVYKAVPEDSIACSAANNGCSSYYGNNANNLRLVISDNFEQGTYAPWVNINGGVDLSNESLSNNGHSIRGATGGAMLRGLPQLGIRDNKQYSISWWMKSDATITDMAMELGLYDLFGNSFLIDLIDPLDGGFQNIEAGRWHYYTTSVYIDTAGSVDFTSLANASAIIITNNSPINGQGLYIDNFTVKEAENSFAVIRDSWNTPVSCDSPYEGYHLGCQSYRDLNSQEFNLKSFDHLCREEAIGCVPAIKTQNSGNPFEFTYNQGDYSEITVPADKKVYLVPDPNNYCSSGAKGCMELGLADRLDANKYTTVYKINDPDRYNDILCDSDGLNCSEYNTSQGTFYLKDPGIDTCTYQQNVLIDGNMLSGWFKTANLSDPVPLGCADTDNDPYDINGIYDISKLILPRDYCSVSDTNSQQLFYFTRDDCEDNGGYWNNYLMAGQCPASEDSCTIFRDPVDPVNCDPKGSNIDFADYDGFCTDGVSTTQTACTAASATWVFPSRDGYCNSDRYNNERDCVNNGWQWTPYCKEYYYYDNSSIDERSCNGQVDRQSGCVLFYDANNWNGEHSQVTTLYDAAETYEDIEFTNRPASPSTCDPSFDPNCTLTANRLIQVQKDRQCAEWLACKSSVASYDEEAGEYKIICDDLDTCLEFQYDPDSNTTKCKKWGTYDEDVEALTFEKYQSRDTGLRNHIAWSDKEYTGYSIPNLLPVSELSVYNFGEGDNKMSRLVYGITDAADFAGSYAQDCVDINNNAIDGISCNTELNTDGDYYFRGECQDRVCWVGPKVNTVSTSTYAIETRAYAVSDSPFPAAIEPDGVNRISKYKEANICNVGDQNNPDVCELTFKKIVYGQGLLTYYYPQETDNIKIPYGICTSGDTLDLEDGVQVPRICGYNSGDGQVDQYRANRECDTVKPNGEKALDGICSLKTEEIDYINWPGICLEYDFSTPITKDSDINSYYCNQWYPAQKIQGTASLYDNYREAGYFDPSGNDAMFCAVAEPYIIEEDRYYCGHFDRPGEAGLCNVLMKIPAGSLIDLEYANQYPTLLNEGAWISPSDYPGLVTPSTDSPVLKDIIVNGYSKFIRVLDFDTLGLDETTDFMDIIDNMFDAPAGIHRFYWDDDVAGNGSSNSGAFVNLPVTYYRSGGRCEDCPEWANASGCPAGYHYLKSDCKRGGHCGVHRWRNGKLWCNPNPEGDNGNSRNYYVDVRSTDILAGDPAPEYVGACTGDCKFVSRFAVDSNHGRGCLQDPVLGPTYNGILSNYASSTLPGGFDVGGCIASATNNNDCNFVSCIQNTAIADQTATHYCSLYGGCFQYILDINNVLIASQALYEETLRCFENGYDPISSSQIPAAWDPVSGTSIIDFTGPAQVYNEAEVASCMEDARNDFRRFVRDLTGGGFSFNVDEAALQAYCNSCRLADNSARYDNVSIGTDCNAVDPINCYQQCRIVTQLDSEGLLSAVRTDIWWRNDEDDERVKKAFPWTSWYAVPGRGYVQSTDTTYNDDEVLYNFISGLADRDDYNYPDNFSRFGASIGGFVPTRIISTRAPYYYVSPDNPTSGTFFSYLDPLVDTLDTATDRAHLQMQDIFYRVYNLDWSSSSSTYEYYGEFELAGGNHENPYAGPDYSPRILAACGDGLCDVVDNAGNVVDVEQGITVNGVRGGTLIGQEGSLFVNTRFFYHAHPDHMPIYSVDADWGDGVVNNFSLNPGKYKNSLPDEYCDPAADAPGDANSLTPGREPQLMGFSGLDRACQPGYKVFYHDYLYDATRNHDCNGTSSGAPGTPIKPVIPNASCYQPRIRVMDNWGWFRVVPFDGWIIVYED